MNYYERALELRAQTVSHRRFFHKNAEVGLSMPKAPAYVMEKLSEYGLSPQKCGHGVTATVGSGGNCILLRADMDALPMREESGELFACPTGTEAHACGHDLHAAMLLTAAKMLKENEADLKGTVKFMFQTGEEIFEGAKDMMANGILENPKVDAALAFHVAAGRMPVGIYMYNAEGTMMSSADGFRITVTGRGSHGACPQSAIDPISIAVHIYQGLETLIAREADPSKNCVLTVGSFNAGFAANIIPDTAELQGTIRCDDSTSREQLVRRMQEVAVKTAAVYGGTAEVRMLSQVPALICDPELTEKLVGYMKELDFPDAMPQPGISASASEDFASIAQQVPGTFVYLSAGFPDHRGAAPAHNPKVRFNEDVCPIGAACYAHCATRWLQDHAKI